MAKRLFVGNLAWATTDESLRNFFAQAGTVESATVIINKFNGRSKGFGFVEMATEEEAEKAKALGNQDLDGRTIFVNDARPPVDHSNGQSTSTQPPADASHVTDVAEMTG